MIMWALIASERATGRPRDHSTLYRQGNKHEYLLLYFHDDARLINLGRGCWNRLVSRINYESLDLRLSLVLDTDCLASSPHLPNH
jgi:hypothetical protein